MNQRPNFIKHCEELRTDETYPGDTETFGTGAALERLKATGRQ